MFAAHKFLALRTIPSRFVCRNEGRFQPEEPAGVRRNRARGRTGRRRATISHDSGRSQDANGGRHDDADTFGVFLNTNPLMPKMAATYIHNLTTILGDTNSNVSATPLSYSISDEPPRYTIGSCKEQRYLRACSMERSGYRRECYRNDCSAASYDGQCV